MKIFQVLLMCLVLCLLSGCVTGSRDAASASPELPADSMKGIEKKSSLADESWAEWVGWFSLETLYMFASANQSK